MIFVAECWREMPATGICCSFISAKMFRKHGPTNRFWGQIGSQNGFDLYQIYYDLVQ